MNKLARIPAQDGLTTLHDRVGRLVSDLFSDDLLRNGERSWVPALDVVDAHDALVVNVELPGVDPREVELTVTGEYLEISGTKPFPEKVESAKWYRFERQAGAFQRRIHLPYPIDAERIEATAKHGLMTIRLPKTPDVMPKKIKVNIA